MKAIMIIESWFGNTATVGQEILAGLHSAGIHVTMSNVAEALATIPAGTDLLLIGAPTHNRGLSTPSTRAKAASASGPAGNHAAGVREWLDSIALPDGLAIAVFDTVTGKNFIAGSAAKGAAKILTRRFPGVHIETRSFVVRGTAGPLADGALTEAREWGAQLAATTS